MTPFLAAARDLLKSVGCTDVKVRQLSDDVGQAKAVVNGKDIFARLQLNAEWGSGETTPTGKSWSDARYPYNCVHFPLPTPAEANADYTHHILIGGDSERAILTPQAVIQAAAKAAVHGEGDSMRQIAVVKNWTPKVMFFVATGDQWKKDEENVWTEPAPVSTNIDEFLKSW
jgi:hypothetical protein